MRDMLIDIGSSQLQSLSIEIYFRFLSLPFLFGVVEQFVIPTRNPLKINGKGEFTADLPKSRG